MVKTAFSDSGMVFSCFKMAKCEKFHADLRFHFLAFRLRKLGVWVLIFANVMRNTPFSALECGDWGLHCCGLKKESGKSELRFPPLPIANRRNASVKRLPVCPKCGLCHGDRGIPAFLRGFFCRHKGR